MANLMIHSTCLCVAVLESFCTRNLEKVVKIMNIQDYLEKFPHFSSLLNVCFHVNRSTIKCQSTEKNLENSRNSAKIYLKFMKTPISFPWNKTRNMYFLFKRTSIFQSSTPVFCAIENDSTPLNYKMEQSIPATDNTSFFYLTGLTTFNGQNFKSVINLGPYMNWIMTTGIFCINYAA